MPNVNPSTRPPLVLRPGLWDEETIELVRMLRDARNVSAVLVLYRGDWRETVTLPDEEGSA